MEIEGDVYPINTDFRAGVAFHMAAISGEPISAGPLLELFFPQQRPGFAAAKEAIFAFLCGGQKPGQGRQGQESPPPFAFGTDAGAILAAFETVYHIDLSTAELHWWRFLALLQGLLEPSFADRVRIRTSDPGKIEDRKARMRLHRLQERYAIDRRGQPVKAPTTLEEYEALLLAQARGDT